MAAGSETVRCPACGVGVLVEKIDEPNRCMGGAEGRPCPIDAMKKIVAARQRAQAAKDKPTNVLAAG